MKGFKIIFLVLVVCVLLVGGAYVYKYGWPELFKKEKLALENIVEEIDLGEEIKYLTSKSINIYVYKNTSIIYEIVGDEQNSEENTKVVFSLKNNILSTQIDTKYIPEELTQKIIASMFNAIARMMGYASDESVYSLILDATQNKSLENDGYTYVKDKGIYTFSINTRKNLKLVDKTEIYIKSEDLVYKRDILANKLKTDIISKPGIAVEKVVTYNNTITLFVYEKGELSQRTYNSMMAIINVLTKNEQLVNNIKANYPTITHKGSVTIDNVTINLNEKLSDNCIHYYNYDLEEYEYLKITFRIQDIP